MKNFIKEGDVLESLKPTPVQGDLGFLPIKEKEKNSTTVAQYVSAYTRSTARCQTR